MRSGRRPLQIEDFRLQIELAYSLPGYEGRSSICSLQSEILNYDERLSTVADRFPVVRRRLASA
jgi:hypothetical protein